MQNSTGYADSFKNSTLYSFMLNSGRMRGYFIDSTLLVNIIKEKHTLGIMETLLLGHAFTGTALLAASLKNNESIKLKIECSGPAQGLSVEAFSTGEIRGYLFENPFNLDFEIESLDTSPFIGAGFLSVTRHMENSKTWSGQVMIEHGRIAEDLANYYLVSEQVKSAFNLSIYFDRNGKPAGAGGLFIQAMPEALDADINKAEASIAVMPSIGKFLSANSDAQGFILDSFSGSDIKLTGEKNFFFKCRCSRERFFSFIKAMDKKEIYSILDEGPVPLVTKCHNCSTQYSFSREEIESIIKTS